MDLLYTLSAFLLIICNLDTISGYFISIDAHAEECFYDKVVSGTKMSLMFEVAEGGFLDIDVSITGPEGKNIYQGERESNGKYTFAAHMDGMYKYCFGNKMSTMTPKIVMFSMDIGDKPKTGVEGEGGDDQGKVTGLLKELTTTLDDISDENEYMLTRIKIHNNINDNTNSRVVLWSFFEALVLVAMTLGQIYYLKRFFEVRRIV